MTTTVLFLELMMMCALLFMSFNSTLTGATGEAGTADLSGESVHPRFQVRFVLLNVLFSM
jgi:hypothetical protein